MSRKYKRKDHFYEKAKDEGYRSRAAYKLIELQERHSVIKPGNKVLDLGCFPGGWIQVASELVSSNGLVFGIDLAQVQSIASPTGARIIIEQADLSNRPNFREILKSHGLSQFDVVLSDMSPKLTGISDQDQARCEDLLNLAIDYCFEVLKPGGSFVAKVFPGGETESIFKKNKNNWKTLLKKSLTSSRNSSQELYIIGLGFKPQLDIKT